MANASVESHFISILGWVSERDAEIFVDERVESHVNSVVNEPILSSDLLTSSGFNQSNSGTGLNASNNTEVKFWLRKGSDGSGSLVEEEVVVFSNLGESSDSVSNNNLLGTVQDHELAVSSESRLVLASDSSVSLPEFSVSLDNLRLILIEDGPGEEIESSVGDSSVVEGESNKGSEVVVGWLLAKSSLPEVLDASWNFVVLVSSSSDGSLNPGSEDLVVNWFSSDDALNDLVEPLVSGGTWSSSNDLDEIVDHGVEWSLGSLEESSVPSDSGSNGVLLVPDEHVSVGEGVSNWLLWLGSLGFIWGLEVETWWRWLWCLLWSLWSWHWGAWLWLWNWWDWLNNWLGWSWGWLWHSSGQEPGLVESVMAVPESNMSLMLVNSTMNIKALLAIVSDVSS